MCDQYIIDSDILEEFVDETQNRLYDLERLIESLKGNSIDHDIIDEMFRLLHTIKGNSSIFGFMKIKSLAHGMEDVLELVRSEKVVVNDAMIHDFLLALDCLQDMVTSIHENRQELQDKKLYTICLDKILSYV